MGDWHSGIACSLWFGGVPVQIPYMCIAGFWHLISYNTPCKLKAQEQASCEWVCLLVVAQNCGSQVTDEKTQKIKEEIKAL